MPRKIRLKNKARKLISTIKLSKMIQENNNYQSFIYNVVGMMHLYYGFNYRKYTNPDTVAIFNVCKDEFERSKKLRKNWPYPCENLGDLYKLMANRIEQMHNAGLKFEDENFRYEKRKNMLYKAIIAYNDALRLTKYLDKTTGHNISVGFLCILKSKNKKIKKSAIISEKKAVEDRIKISKATACVYIGDESLLKEAKKILNSIMGYENVEKICFHRRFLEYEHNPRSLYNLAICYLAATDFAEEDKDKLLRWARLCLAYSFANLWYDSKEGKGYVDLWDFSDDDAEIKKAIDENHSLEKLKYALSTRLKSERPKNDMFKEQIKNILKEAGWSDVIQG